jgi:hypothetical protein
MELFIVVGIITFYAVIWTRISNVICDALSPDAKAVATWLMQLVLVPLTLVFKVATALITFSFGWLRTLGRGLARRVSRTPSPAAVKQITTTK